MTSHTISSRQSSIALSSFSQEPSISEFLCNSVILYNQWKPPGKCRLLQNTFFFHGRIHNADDMS